MNNPPYWVECRSCRGSGLYRGFAEPKGTAVVCFTCGGEGKEKNDFRLGTTPFHGRKRIEGVQKVYRSKGTFVLSCGPTGQFVTYQEFLAGKLP